MIKLEAPVPAVETTTLLPNPAFSDSEALVSELSQHRTMVGGLFTYVKSKDDRRKLTMQFQIDRLKGLELRAFCLAYYRSRIRLTDHLDVKWNVYLMNNPFEFDTKIGEQQLIQLEFEECAL